jgi:hypothetical protein
MMMGVDGTRFGQHSIKANAADATRGLEPRHKPRNKKRKKWIKIKTREREAAMEGLRERKVESERISVAGRQERKFSFNGRSLTIKAEPTNAGWAIQVYEGPDEASL